MLLPAACAVCDAVGPSPCRACRARIRRAPTLPVPAGLDRCSSLLAYEGAGRELVARLKYRNRRASLPWLASGMAELVVADVVDLVTWIPTTTGRRRRRGFDQAELLAAGVGRALDRPVGSLLVRQRGVPQTGRSRVERLTGPAFTVRRPLAGPATRVLIVDDVCTTGATLTAAARTLRAAGAARLEAVTAAQALRRNADDHSRWSARSPID